MVVRSEIEVENIFPVICFGFIIGDGFGVSDKTHLKGYILCMNKMRLLGFYIEINAKNKIEQV